MKKILMLLLVLCMVSACTPTEPVTTDEVIETPQTVTPVENEKVNLIEKSNEEINYDDFELLGQYAVKIEGIDEDAEVNLYTSAERDKKGELMWDDSQEWVLDVETAFGTYVLYDERINGQAYMKVIKSYNDDSDETIINLHIYANTYNEIREYRFGGEFFEERILYTTDETSTQGISELYTSIPSYQ